MATRKILLLFINVVLIIATLITYALYVHANSPSGNPSASYICLVIIIATLLYPTHTANHYIKQYSQLGLIAKISAYITVALLVSLYYDQYNSFSHLSIYDSWKNMPIVPQLVLNIILPIAIVIAAISMIRFSISKPDIHTGHK